MELFPHHSLVKPGVCWRKHGGQRSIARTLTDTVVRTRLLLLSRCSALMLALGVPVCAQTIPPAILFETSPVTSAPPVNAPAFRIMSLAELSERYTDNAALAIAAGTQSDWVTDATAGFRVDYLGARAKAMLDYRVNRLVHAQLANLDTTQHRLNSNATLEAVEKWLFLDTRASITRQNRSAFGAASISDITSTSANQVETTTYQISPYIRGNFSNAATYLFRVNAAETHTGGGLFPDSKTYQWNGFVRNAPSSGRLGWSIDGNAFSIDNITTDRRYDSIFRGTVTFEVDGQLHLSLSAGREYSDLDGLGKRVTNSPGLGLEWSPSQRTQLAAVTQKRFFGYDHLFNLTHRTTLTAWRFSSTSETAFFGNDSAGSSPVTVNSLLLDLLASAIPDPNARAEAAQRRFAQTGIPSSSGIQDGLLTVRPFLRRQQDASVALLGPRNTAMFSVGRRKQRSIDNNSVASGGGALIEDFRQFSVNAAWAYRLSPVSTLRMVISYLHTEGLFSEDIKSTQRLQSLFFVTQIGPRTSTSLGLQRIIFDSTVANSYRENAFVASLSLRF